MFDDDNFWVKLDIDDDEIEFMGKQPTYNGSKYRNSNANCNSCSQPTKTSRAVAVTCDVQDDSSLFDKTKTGKILLAFILALPMTAYIFLVLTIIFLISDSIIYIPFAICFGVFAVAFAVVCRVRLVLNKKYKLLIAEQEKKKQNSNKKSISKTNNKNKKPN